MIRKKKSPHEWRLDVFIHCVYLTSGAGTGLAEAVLVALPQSFALASPQVLAQSLFAADLSLQSALALSLQSAFFAAAGVADSDFTDTVFSVDFLVGTFCATTLVAEKANINAMAENNTANFFMVSLRLD